MIINRYINIINYNIMANHQKGKKSETFLVLNYIYNIYYML